MSPSDEEMMTQMHASRHRPIGRILFWLVLLAVIAVAGKFGYDYWQAPPAAPVYKAVPVVRSTIRAVVSATGTLQPTSEVEVGSELSGRIARIYVDYNDPVKKGQLLARLDTERIEAQVLQSRAALKIAEASVVEARASRVQAEREFDSMTRMRELSGGKMPSQLEYDATEAAMLKARAVVTRAEAQVEQANANLEQIIADLSRADIVSPIDGVVLVRAVSEGQTVAATMSAPVLFRLAEDLKSMELQVDIDEADVSVVEPGQHATFTVDAYPGRSFPAMTRLIRLGAESVSGVVTYKTMLDVENAAQELRPGMTAVAEILVKEKPDVLLIPQAALRFTPEWADAANADKERSMMDSLVLRPGSMRPRTRAPGSRDNGTNENGDEKWVQVYRLVNGQPQPVMIRTGEQDGDRIEVVEGDLTEQDSVITGVEVRS